MTNFLAKLVGVLYIHYFFRNKTEFPFLSIQNNPNFLLRKSRSACQITTASVQSLLSQNYFNRSAPDPTDQPPRGILGRETVVIMSLPCVNVGCVQSVTINVSCQVSPFTSSFGAFVWVWLSAWVNPSLSSPDRRKERVGETCQVGFCSWSKRDWSRPGNAAEWARPLISIKAARSLSHHEWVFAS